MKTEIFPDEQKSIKKDTSKFPRIVNLKQLKSYPLHTIILEQEGNNIIYFLRPAPYSVFAKISSSFKAYYYDPYEIQSKGTKIRKRDLTSCEIEDFNRDIEEFMKLHNPLLKLFDNSDHSDDNWMPFALRCSKIIIDYIAYKIPLELIGKIISVSSYNTDIPISPSLDDDYKPILSKPGLELFDRMEPNAVYKKYNWFFYRTEFNYIDSWTSEQLKKGIFFTYEYHFGAVPINIEKEEAKSIPGAQFLKFLEDSSKKFEKGQIAEYTSSGKMTYRFQIIQQLGDDAYKLDVNPDQKTIQPHIINQFKIFRSTNKRSSQNSTHLVNDEKIMKTPSLLSGHDQSIIAPVSDNINSPSPQTQSINLLNLMVGKKANQTSQTNSSGLFVKPTSHPEMQWQFGLAYANGSYGIQQDFEEAVRLFQLASAQGHPEAHNSLGTCYYHGNGVAKNLNEAIRYYRLAADKGVSSAQYNLACLYRDGEGVNKDNKEAVRLYRLAAEQNHARAQYKLACCYSEGTGVDKDDKEAVRLFLLAAEQNHVDALYKLACCYLAGTGVNKNDKVAARLFRLAAKRNHVGALYNLACCYSAGAGVVKNDKEAVRLFRLAAKQKHVGARYNRADCYLDQWLETWFEHLRMEPPRPVPEPSIKTGIGFLKNKNNSRHLKRILIQKEVSTAMNGFNGP